MTSRREPYGMDLNPRPVEEHGCAGVRWVWRADDCAGEPSHRGDACWAGDGAGVQATTNGRSLRQGNHRTATERATDMMTTAADIGVKRNRRRAMELDLGLTVGEGPEPLART